jgi:hypothetical protein
MKRIIILAALLLTSCQTVKPQSQNPQPTTSNFKEVTAETPVAEKYLISAKGIGKAKLGMTVGELKQISAQDTQFEVVSSLMVDVQAIAVSQNGIVQYYILYGADTTSDLNNATVTDNHPITHLMTDNYNYQTLEGVKAGMTIKDAEAIYGDAILAYNIEGESKEYVTFGNQNLENIEFKASYFKEISNGLGFSGVYPEYPGGTYTTNKYRDDAAIAAIEVSCNPDDCLTSDQ